MDDTIGKVEGVHFVISCVTGTATNRKRNNDRTAADISPGIGFVIAFNESKTCNERRFYNILHDSGELNFQYYIFLSGLTEKMCYGSVCVFKDQLIFWITMLS